MSEPIKAGDLVMIVGGEGPECLPFIGLIRTVDEDLNIHGHRFFSLIPSTIYHDGGEVVWHKDHLRKIPELKELGFIEHKEELTA